jgi:glycosyltransferase involved in cell wall biosynthesis
MPAFLPFSIQNLSLNQLANWHPGSGNHYLIVWYKKIPLGHLWIEHRPDNHRVDLQSSIYESLYPSLWYIFSRENQKMVERWETLLARGEYDKIAGCLEKLQTETPNSKNVLPGKLSVVVCSRQRPQSLKRCIDSLLNGTDKDFELIIVDNTSGDQSVLDILKEHPWIKYVQEERKGLGIARNTGLRASTRDIIAFTDDDVEVDKDWIFHLKTSFENPLTMAVTGLVIPSELQTHSQYIFERYWGFNRGYVPRTFDHRFFLNNLDRGVPVWDIGAGANMAFRRDVFELAGGFDERLEAGAAGCSGDTEFWYRILAEGWNCQYFPHILVYHEHRKTKNALRSQLYHYARGHACALLVQYEKYHQKGNLRRLYQILPGDFIRKIWRNIRLSHFRNLRTVWREIRGSFAGWFYYQMRRKKPGYTMPYSLSPHPDWSNGPKSELLVSVIIPCYNQAGYLGEAIQSAQNQTHRQIEIIVVDDGSTEDVFSISSQYPEIKYIRVERVGLAAARNIGAGFSQGDFLVFLDADDLLYPEAVSIQLGYFSKMPHLAYVSGAHDKIDERGSQLPVAGPYEKPDDNYCSLLLGNYIGMEATVMYRKELFFRFHFDPRLKASEDYALNLEISRRFPVFGHTQKIAVYRIHGENLSLNVRLMLDMTLKVLRSQKPSLRDGREWKAYRMGYRNWKSYYRRIGNIRYK